MKKLVIAGFLLAGFLGANAQSIRVVSGSVTTSSTGGSTSVNIGQNSGNVNPANTGGANVFLGMNTGTNNTTGGSGTFIGGNAGGLNTTGSDNVFIGGNAGYFNTTGERNTFTGVNAGHKNTAGYNSFYGYMTGFNNTTGGGNSFFGMQAGANNTIGSQNIFIGTVAGGANTIGTDNSFVGWGAGPANTTGNYNSFFGRSAGNGNTTGLNNTIVGSLAGHDNSTGSANVFLGFAAGRYETSSNKLYISNNATTTPLIWGDFAASRLKLNGAVGIGAVTTFPTNPLYANYKLFVTGGILTDEVRVVLSGSGTWADYVFAKDYKLPTIKEVEAFIAKNSHLPNVPSAKQVQEEGINIGDMARIQQEKIEELMLYIIELNKKSEAQAQKIEALEAKMSNK